MIGLQTSQDPSGSRDGILKATVKKENFVMLLINAWVFLLENEDRDGDFSNILICFTSVSVV